MSKSIKFYLALYASKMACVALKVLKRNATHYPGWVALKICPDFLGQVDKPEQLIGVMGTNGKTTVSNMINDVLDQYDYVCLNNRLGSNIREGVATSLLKACSLTGKMKYRWGVLEIDERSSRLILPHIKPDYIVVTNIFRDSIKRNAHTDFIFDILTKSIPDTTTLILNSDDPLSNQLKPNNERFFYGISPLPHEQNKENNIIKDVMLCPHCGEKLSYSFHRYHHLGHVYCTKCGYKNPKPDYLITNVNYEESKFTALIKDKEYDFHMISDNLVNIYNQLSTISVLNNFGISIEELQKAFNNMEITKSRASTFSDGDSKVMTVMSKGQNAVACSRVFDYVHFTEGKKQVIIMLDDNDDAKNSSENLNWVYDADFELLNDDNIERIIVGGKRCFDYKVRLMLAGVAEDKIITSIDENSTIDYIVKDNSKVFILHDIWKYQQCQNLAKELVERLK